MDRNQAKEFYPFLQAFAEGKAIECRTKPSALSKSWQGMNDWTEIKEIGYWDNIEYRIKPEPKYRPFKDAEECWAEMQKHQPFGWVKDRNGSKFVIENVDSRGFVEVYDDGTCSFKEVFENRTFADGTPFGVKVEQLMYRPITMYQIVCDRCGEVFGGTDTCSALFSNKEVDIGDYSDWEMIDGKHYCPDCYEVEVIDGVYNIKAKQI